GINTIKRLKDILDIIGLPEKNYRIDFHLARGLDYYTGLIFETIIPSMPYIGSLSGGGRYDELIKIFTGENIPSVGTTVGLDRIMTVLAELNILDEKKSETLIMFVNFRDEKLENVALKLVRDCRENGIPAELYYSGKKLRAQLEYANKLKIPYVGFLGENELKEGTVLLRNMNTGAETRLGLENFVMEFKRLISSGKS
ncbi:MAG: His/Gly/Thr/Pro-type tRNA ligase C-terminal domain-containing protein, partial [bacterium]